MYEYQAAGPEELSIRPDDVIEVLDKDTVPGWWKGTFQCTTIVRHTNTISVGTLNGQSGFFPSNYVEEL